MAASDDAGTQTKALQTLADEAEIRRLAAQFSDACVRYDRALFHSLWEPEGVWEITEPFPAVAEGVENILALLDGLLGMYEFFVQMQHSGVIAVTGDAATARWVMQEVGRGKDGALFYNNFGLYEDQMARRGGAWRFVRRTYQYVYIDHSPLPGTCYTRLPDVPL